MDNAPCLLASTKWVSVHSSAKYRPEFPARGFEDLDDARRWATDFVRWDNTEPLSSGIRTVTPEQRHSGEDLAILAARDQRYRAARQANPARWSRQTRNWTAVGAVTLNPERKPETIPQSAQSMPLAA